MEFSTGFAIIWVERWKSHYRKIPIDFPNDFFADSSSDAKKVFISNVVICFGKLMNFLKSWCGNACECWENNDLKCVNWINYFRQKFWLKAIELACLLKLRLFMPSVGFRISFVVGYSSHTNFYLGHVWIWVLNIFIDCSVSHSTFSMKIFIFWNEEIKIEKFSQLNGSITNMRQVICTSLE